MPQFIFVYLGGDYPNSSEEAQAHLEEYQQWMIDLGDKVISPAIPFKDTHVIQSDGTAEPGTASSMSGMSIFQMASMEDAVKVAQSCPFLKINGVLEISEMVEMTGEAQGHA